MSNDQQAILGTWIVKFKQWTWEYTFTPDGRVTWKDPFNGEHGAGRWGMGGSVIYFNWTGSATKESWHCPISDENTGWYSASYGTGPVTSTRKKTSAGNYSGDETPAELLGSPPRNAMMIPLSRLNELFPAMDRIPEMRGAGMIYLNGNATRMVRNSAHVTGMSTWLVMEEIDLEPVSPPRPVKQTNAQMLNSELFALGLNCGSMVLLAIASAGATICTAGTVGACTPVLSLTALGAVATGAQCGMSIGRIIEATLLNPSETGLATLDADPWYQSVNVTLEVASITGIAATGVGSYKKIRSAEEFAKIVPDLVQSQKVEIGKDLANLLRYEASQSTVNQTVIRWARGGKLNAIFFDATRTLQMNKVKLFADAVSAILSSVSVVKTDAIVPAYRGIRMFLVQQ